MDSASPLLGINADQMGEVFPFHIAFDRHLKIVQTGNAVTKICSAIKPGASLGRLARIKTPAGIAFEFDAICDQAFTVFFVEITTDTDTNAILKGQMLCDSTNDTILFLCSPVAQDTKRVAAMGLELNDFAIHDATVDFLILLQTKDNTINDVRKMAERLRKEVTVRREAENALKEANESLEKRVTERTLELSDANRELQLWIHKLEVQNRQISLLNRMGDMLQACRSVKETYSVIMDTAQQLFPTDSGLVALRNEESERYEVVTTWGQKLSNTVDFEAEQCWGLRRSRLHVVEQGEENAICDHLTEVPNGGYICAPLLVRGKKLGVIHLRCDTRPLKKGHNPDFFSADERKHLIHTAAEHISLAIANLKLQESLRQQSIKDPLTGLFNRRHMEASLNREVDRARRSGQPISVIMTDVDHFKSFNDTWGHLAGDELLKGLGNYLETHVRSGDIACRYGGEEFILILPGATPEQALMRAEAIRQGVEHDLVVKYHKETLPPVTISLGIATYPLHAEDALKTVKTADAALYLAKRQGRNRSIVAEMGSSHPSEA